MLSWLAAAARVGPAQKIHRSLPRLSWRPARGG